MDEQTKMPLGGNPAAFNGTKIYGTKIYGEHPDYNTNGNGFQAPNHVSFADVSDDISDIISLSEAARVRPAPTPTQAEREPKKPKKAKGYMNPWAYVDILKNLGYTFRMNDLDDTIEINGAKISDALEARVKTDLRAAGHTDVNVARDAYIAHASLNPFNPITDYLNAQQWDGQDHIAKLASYFTDKHSLVTYPNGEQRTVFHAFFRRWLVGAVDKVENQRQNAMLVLGGSQGLGKSYLAGYMTSKLPDFGHEGPMRPDVHQETYMLMTTTFVWEVGELGATTRRQDVEAIKQIVMQKKAKYKPPYGHNLIEKNVTASFVGTVNDDGTGYLKDTTGNRRFMCVDLISIDRRYSSEVDVNQVWAQAVALCKAGETGTPLACEVAIRDVINSDHTMLNPIEDYLDEYYEVDPQQSDNVTKTIDMVELLKEKGYKGNERQMQMEIAQSLKGRGCVNEKRPSRWVGVKYR